MTRDGGRCWRRRSSAIGYGVPVGIGAAIGNEGRPMVIFEGDGSLMQNVHVLETPLATTCGR